MSRHRRQQHKRARRGRALQAQLDALQWIVFARAHELHGHLSVQSFRWIGVHKGIARAQFEAIAVPSLHRVSVRGTITL